MQRVLPALELQALSLRHDHLERARDDPAVLAARALHRVRLARARLAVCKDAAPVASDGRIHERGDLIEDLQLARALWEDLVKPELPLDTFVYNHLDCLLAVHGALRIAQSSDAGVTIVVHHRPDAAEYTDVALELADRVVHLLAQQLTVDDLAGHVRELLCLLADLLTQLLQLLHQVDILLLREFVVCGERDLCQARIRGIFLQQLDADCHTGVLVGKPLLLRLQLVHLLAQRLELLSHRRGLGHLGLLISTQLLQSSRCI